MNITVYSVIITIIGGLILFVAGVKSGVKIKYKLLFMLIGLILFLLGAYGIFTSFLN